MTKNLREINKQKIIQLFNTKVKGKSPDTSSQNQHHDGKNGHWLETMMGVVRNNKTAPDILGFEMKNHTGSKTTFGDWSPDFTLFKRGVDLMTRDQFLTIFGSPNPKKNGRYSWSGRPCPKIGSFNFFGQKLEITKNNDILAIYSFSKDQRPDKKKIIPKNFQKEKLIIARWSFEVMKKRVEEKFCNLGWFKCVQDSTGKYTGIVFGKPIKFNDWLAGVKKGLVYFDGGMYQGNPRPYSQWRADNRYWNLLVTERY